MKTITVSAEPLREILTALSGPGHLFRELQAVRNPLFGPNPIDTLVSEYNAAVTVYNDNLTAAESVCLEVTAEMIEACLGVLDKMSDFHHPDVPFLGTENGDTEEAWRKRVMEHALRAALSVKRKANTLTASPAEG